MVFEWRFDCVLQFASKTYEFIGTAFLWFYRCFHLYGALLSVLISQVIGTPVGSNPGSPRDDFYVYHLLIQDFETIISMDFLSPPSHRARLRADRRFERKKPRGGDHWASSLGGADGARTRDLRRDRPAL